MPDRKNDVTGYAILAIDQAIKFPLRPLLGEKTRTNDDDAEARLAQAVVNRSTEAVAYAEAELVVPDLHVFLDQTTGQGPDKVGLIFARMADEGVKQHIPNLERGELASPKACVGSGFFNALDRFGKTLERDENVADHPSLSVVINGWITCPLPATVRVVELFGKVIDVGPWSSPVEQREAESLVAVNFTEAKEDLANIASGIEILTA